MIQSTLVRLVRLIGASIRCIAWLLMVCVVLALFTIGMACILARLAFNTPMIVWRAANTKAPHQ